MEAVFCMDAEQEATARRRRTSSGWSRRARDELDRGNNS